MTAGGVTASGSHTATHEQAQRRALAPHPVAGSLHRLPIRTAHPRRTSAFDMVGATWNRAHPPHGTVEVRVRHGQDWGRWHRLTLDDAGPNAGSADASTAERRDAVTTTPLWVGFGGDGVALRVVGPDGTHRRTPRDLHVLLVNGGRSAADSQAAIAHVRRASSAGSSRPFIYSRRDWGADERIRRHATGKGCGHPKYGSSVKVAFIHHTDTPNGYSRRAVPAIIRSMYRYHVFGHNWCDIGYNFLVDRFGRIWQGRFGGMTKAVIGAQSGGFNVDSTGIAMIGTFNSVSPDRAMRRAVVRLLAWRLAAEFRDPLGREKLHADKFYESRYRAGQRVSFRVISGHRNADYTDCPGTRGYAALPGIRRAVMARLASGLVDPKLSGHRVWRFGTGGAPVIQARALKAEAWRLDVVDATGSVINTTTGTSSSGGRITARWDGTTALFGSPVPPGRYQLVLTSSRNGQAGVPFRAAVKVAPAVTITGPAITGYQSAVTLHGTAIPKAPVTVTVSGHPTRTVSASATGGWSTTYVATSTSRWTASIAGYTTPAGTTTVVPIVTSPAPVHGIITPSSSMFTLSGTAVPLALAVSVMSNGTEIGSSGVNTSGQWSVPLTLAGRTTITVVAAGGATSPQYIVVPPGS